MIAISRIQNQVNLQFQTMIEGSSKWTYTFTWTTDREDYAQLLVNQFNDTMRDVISGARKEAYDQGWKDAKAKNRRRDWFAGWL